jgi:hypothetical protein
VLFSSEIGMIDDCVFGGGGWDNGFMSQLQLFSGLRLRLCVIGEGGAIIRRHAMSFVVIMNVAGVGDSHGGTR